MELRIAFCIYFSKLLANSSEEESISDNASRKLLKTSSKDTWVNDSFRRSLISSVSSLHAIICDRFGIFFHCSVGKIAQTCFDTFNLSTECFYDVPARPSQELIAKVGKENIERAYNTYNYSQQMVADGSFVRMKNISLGYNMPDKFLKKVRLHATNLRLNITNPFLIYSDKKLKGQDPEYYKSGGVSLPTPKQYTVTLNIGF